MKTPEEIKKGLECCAAEWAECEECTYCDGCVMRGGNENLDADALAYIKELEQRLAQVERERDAAVRDVRSLCATNYFSGDYCEYCKYREPDGQCFHDCTPYSSEWGWEWRGVCDENVQEERNETT